MDLEAREFISKEYCNFLLAEMFKLKADNSFCDVFFTSDSKSVSAHSCLLAAVSPFLKRYFLSYKGICETGGCHKPIHVPLTSVTKMFSESHDNCMECLSNIIKFIYTGHITIEDLHFSHVLNIACNLEVKDLINICQNYNSKDISIGKSICVSISLEETDTTIVDYEISLLKNSKEVVESSDSITKYSSKTTGHDNNAISTSNLANQNIKAIEKPDQNINITGILTKDFIKNKKLLNENKGMHLKPNKNCSKNNSSSSTKGRASPKKAQKDIKENKFLSNEIFVCLECREEFPAKTLYDHHKSVFHSNRFNCLHCNFSDFSFEKIINHILVSKHGNKCSLCLKVFKNNYFLLKHCRNDHCLPCPFTCDYCQSKFINRNLWKKHLIIHKAEHTVYKCSVCLKAFNTKIKMKLHNLKVHNNTEKICDICGYKTSYRSYLKRHMLKHDKKLLQCSSPDCSFTTSWLYNLKDHLKTHTKKDVKFFKCDVCEKSYSQNKNLKRHFKTVHSNSKLFNCTACNYQNRRLDKVKEHCQRMHREIINIYDKLSHQCIDDSFTSVKQCDFAYKTTSADNSTKSKSENLDLEESTINQSIDRVLYLNETTGELTFLCNNDNKSLTNLISVNKIALINENNSFPESMSNSVRVILNETTGELICIHLNDEKNKENDQPEISSHSNSEVDVTVLDETTGEILRKSQLVPVENDQNNIDFDIFDTIDFDAMNDDYSLDGFDDYFESSFFDAEFNSGPTSPDMDKILNEYTGELFTDENACHYVEPWEKNKKDSKDANSSTQFSNTFLDEVTGELIDKFS